MTGPKPPVHEFRVLDVLGQGGFAKVYRAEKLGPGGYRQLVALKFIKEGIEHEQDMLRRLRDEARLLGMLRHRAIVGAHGLTHLDRGWAVVMEYVEGVDAHAFLDRTGLPPAVALEVASEVAAALHAAWTHLGPDGRPLHLVHRDIKPSNVFLTLDGTVKVLDFGAAIAEFADREAKSRSFVLGSMRYMGPERLHGFDPPAGDIYALGVTLGELLIGCPATPKHLGEFAGRELGSMLAEAVWAHHEQHAGSWLRPTVRLIEQMTHLDAVRRPAAVAVTPALARLAAAAPGAPLRTWALQGIGPRWETRGANRKHDELCGTLLRERSEMALSPTLVMREETRPRRRRTWAIPAVGAVALAGGLLIGVLQGNGSSRAPNPSSGVSSSPDAGAQSQAHDVAALVEPASTERSRGETETVETEAPAEPPPRRQRQTPSAQAGAPAAAESPPIPDPPTTVRVTGDVPGVRFLVAGARVPPEEVPAGTWTMVAENAGTEQVLGTVTIEPGRVNRVHCSATFKECLRE